MFERGSCARARDEHPRRARCAQRAVVPGGEVDRVHVRQGAPRQLLVGGERLQALAERRDRTLPLRVQQRHRTARGRRARRRAHLHAELPQAQQRTARELVFSQRGQQQRPARQPRQLHGRHRPAPGGLFKAVVRVHHLARARRAGYARELHPLDVANHRHPQSARSHGRQSHSSPPGPRSAARAQRRRPRRQAHMITVRRGAASRAPIARSRRVPRAPLLP